MLWKIIALFFALAFLTYGASLGNDFVRWDDGLLITENPAIREFSPSSITWAFTHFDPELYIPLTYMSYQLEMMIGGGSPFIFHFTNLILHTTNALLVAWLAFLLIKRRDAALFCGLLFLLHPLHTEAVAWASARKDVLAGFFFLGALVSYVIYLLQQSTKHVMLS